MNIWVVIPAFNEEKRIEKVLVGVKKIIKDVIVVDDGSSDNTVQIAEHQTKTLKHIVNLGKGAALKTGCDYAFEQGADAVIVMDADGQHDPNLLPIFIQALKKAPLVYGYRTGFEENMPWFKRMGNFVINTTMRVLYGTTLKDTQSGFRAFTKEAYRKIRWESTDYSMESEMIANAAKAHIAYQEIPISTIYYEKYKGTSILDGIKIVINLIKWRIIN